MRQCSNCGAPLDDDALFCTSCGQKVIQTDSPAEAPVRSADDREQKPVEPAAVNEGRKAASTIRPWHYALGFGVLLIILAAIFVPKMLKDNDKAEQENVAEQSDSDFSEESEPQEDTDDSSEDINYEGWYAYQGFIDKEYEFRITFGIIDHHIEGEYAINGVIRPTTLKGSITDDGTFEMYAYAGHGSQKGQYFTGHFNPDDFRGDILSTEISDFHRTFEATPIELGTPVYDDTWDEVHEVPEPEAADIDIPLSDEDDEDDEYVSVDDEPLSEETEDDRIYEMVEENAQFPGGDNACFNWLSEHIQYPSVCKEQGVQGRVLVNFVINKDGSVVDVKTVKSPDPNLSKEAERVVKMMPKWKPARQGDKIVRSRFTLPIMFRLN